MPLIGPYVVHLKYSYWYDETSRKGELYLEGKKISDILVRRVTHDSQLKAGIVRHTNLLKCFTVDNDRRNLIYEWPKISVKEYIGNWCTDRESRKPIMEYWIPNKSGYNKEKVWYVAPLVRAVIRQLYNFVSYQHTNGKCVTKFTLEDLSMYGEVLMISMVGVYESDNEVLRKENFEWIVAVIKDLVGAETKTNPYPDTLKDLIKKTEDFEYLDVKQEKLLVNHLAILPPVQVIKFIQACGKEFYEYKEETNGTFFDQLPNIKENWKSWFVGIEAFYYVQQCYEHKGQQHVKKYEQTGNQGDMKSSSLRFARNITEHLHEKARMVLDDVHLETIVMRFFHKHLLAAETALFPDKLTKFIEMI